MSDKFKIFTSSKLQNRLNAIIIIGTIISLAATAYWYWQTHINHPEVKILSIDWEKGEAQVIINGKQQTLYANSKLSAGAEWALQFNNAPDGDEEPDRIEIVRGDITYNVLATKDKKVE